MYLRIRGNSFTDNVFEEIAAITDRATLKVREVSHQKERKIIELPIERYDIESRRGVFRTIRPYKRASSRKTKSFVIIRNVMSVKIDKNPEDETMSEVTILFGLKRDGNQLYVSSAEETKGFTCYAITITVSEIDLEIRDENESI